MISLNKKFYSGTHKFLTIKENKISNYKKVIVIRHGESIWNQDSKFTGWTNIPLTNKGKVDATNIGLRLIKNNLIPNIIFSSVLERAIDTSNIIKDVIDSKDIPIHTSWRLNEKHYGTLEGIPRNYIRNLYGDKFTQLMRKSFSMKPPIIKNYSYTETYPIYKNCYFKKIKNGESKENVLNRLLPYFENDILFTLSENKLPLIVTHKHTLRVLMKHLLKMSDEDFENYDVKDNCIITLFFDDDNYFIDSQIF
jgi:2,3-bisphosphoglycerate-dependent phosphoglycerate mutase